MTRMVTTMITPPVVDAPTLEQFVTDTGERQTTADRFAIESSHTLRIPVDGGVWLKPGAAVGYRGQLTFERRPTIESDSFGDAVMREVAPLVRAIGKGQLYCAHESRCHIIRLEGESIFVSWQNLLAFEESLHFEMAPAGGGVGVAAGGMIVLELSGRGSLALGTHGEPLTLNVEPGQPVSTDPQATVAWSEDLTPTLKTDVSWRSLAGHGGQQPIQLLFEGRGFVVVQPSKNPRRFEMHFDPLKKAASLVST
jgi:uncharacterized protein (AIM24 family)